MSKPKIFTAVFRNITNDEAGEITSHPKWSAGSWSHALDDRDDARHALEAANARIAELEAQIATVAPAVDAQPVGEIAHNEIDGFHFAPSVHWLTIGIGTKLYATPQSEGWRKALTEIAEQEHIELMLDPTWAQRVAVSALSQKEPQ